MLPSPSAVARPAGTMSTPGCVSMWYESHWLFTATVTAFANAAPARVARVPSTHTVAPWPRPVRRAPRLSCSITARRAATERLDAAPARPTVSAWFTRAFALSTTVGGSAWKVSAATKSPSVTASGVLSMGRPPRVGVPGA